MIHVRHYWSLCTVISRLCYDLHLEWCDISANDWSIVKMELYHHWYPWIHLHCHSTASAHCNRIWQYIVMATYHEPCGSVCVLLNAIVAVILLYRSAYTVTHCDAYCFLFTTSWYPLWSYHTLDPIQTASQRLALMSVQLFVSLTHHFCFAKL